MTTEAPKEQPAIDKTKEQLEKLLVGLAPRKDYILSLGVHCHKSFPTSLDPKVREAIIVPVDLTTFMMMAGVCTNLLSQRAAAAETGSVGT